MLVNVVVLKMKLHKSGAKIVRKLNEVVMKDVSSISFVDFPENKRFLND